MIARVVQASTTVLLAAFCIFVFGMQSYTSMPRESAPDIPIPVVMVTTAYIGVAPADIEGLITIPMENELASLQDVKAMRSTSTEGASIISIEFEPDVDIDSAMQTVRDKVNRAKPKLPADAEEPSVREISFSDFPILIVTLAGSLDEEGLKELAEPLQDRISRIPGVLEVSLTGGMTREIQVQIDPIRLAHYALGLQDVVNAIRDENVNIPGGNVSATDASILLRVPGDFTDPSQLEQVAIKRRGDRPVFVSDVATVVDTYADRGSHARMDGEPAVSLRITKRTGANIIEVDLGMLVDNAIVVVENIYRHAEMGKSNIQASIDGTQEVAVAVAASTATTVAAFLPLVFWEGIMGGFMGFLPKTLIAVLVASLVVAVFILPVFTAVFMKVGRKALQRAEDQGDGPIMRPYRRLLIWSIDHRYRSAFAGVAVLVGSLVAYGALNHGTEFFPSTQPERGFITVRAPDGTDLETTDRIVRRIEAALSLERNIEVAVAETGVAGGGGQDFGGAQAAPNQATISLDFLPDRNSAEPGDEIRDESSLVTIERLREILAGIPGAELAVDKEGMGPPVGAPISVEVSGEDFHQVGELARQVRRALKEIPGVTELADDYRVGRPELRLRVDRGAAKRVGLTTRTVGNTVRTAVAGQVASTLREGDDEHDILVTLSPKYKQDIQAVLDLRLPGSEMTSPDKFPVPLSTVASFELTGGSGAIRHLDQDLVVTITGDILEGFNQNAVRAQVQDTLDAYPTPPGSHLRMGGADDEQRAAKNSWAGHS
jgi:multidrug efflux pump subunit AcrB